VGGFTHGVWGNSPTEDHRDDPIWRHVAAQVAQAAVGVDVVDLGIALRLALMLEGLEYEAPQ
jgi:hypothetical protein